MRNIYFILFVFCFGFSLNAQIVNIPDANFKAKLLESGIQYGCALNSSDQHIIIDTNNNGEIEINEANTVYSLDLSGANTPNNLKISNLIGISFFSNLKNISVENQLLTNFNYSLANIEVINCNSNLLNELDATIYPNLKQLSCAHNQISNLIINNLINLETIYCLSNQLQQINLSGLVNLKGINVNFNQLTSINLSDCINLEGLNCSDNQLTSLDITNFSNLSSIFCSNNFIGSLNLSGLSPQFVALYCENNQLTTLDLSNYSNIQWLRCSGNNLESMFLKNGSSYSSSLNFSNNPNLQYICVDENKLAQFQSLINSYGYLNCFVNSYCTFVPGGTYYTVNGYSKYDANNNGCDILDYNVSNLKFNVNNSGTIGALFSNVYGNYQMPVIAGNTIITPVLENPTYFSISPTVLNLNFPQQSSPYNQNFCVHANGNHPDLEITILPLECAIPGFDVKYRVFYKNKGTIAQSGTINFTFNDAILDLVSSNPNALGQTFNNLSWNFVNLLPFTTNQIDLVFNLNSPTEIPAVFSGQILNYTATINGVSDQTPLDNNSVLNQIVVNSFDPNDKTCLEGATISTNQVGKEVHYIIRFENNGAANARNIVVKDIIDTAKFDILTLVPINGSNPFVTKISNTNKVEFIFENINLPFDDANNDGYVAFKIKTKPSLVVGDTFSNTANIYFDYNAPIVTNTATTTIQALSKIDFEFSNYFVLSPNPAKNVLNIQSKKDIDISSISIYNTIGQLVQVITNAKDVSTIDVSDLKTGTYFVKINSDKGSSNAKFIKE